jgi:hypothetical protein
MPPLYGNHDMCGMIWFFLLILNVNYVLDFNHVMSEILKQNDVKWRSITSYYDKEITKESMFEAT